MGRRYGQRSATYFHPVCLFLSFQRAKTSTTTIQVARQFFLTSSQNYFSIHFLIIYSRNYFFTFQSLSDMEGINVLRQVDQRLVAQLLVDWNQSRTSSLNQKQSRPRVARIADPAASETGSSAIVLTAGTGSAAATPTATRGVAVPQVPRLEFFIAVVKYFCRSCLLT
jgi:hypothetical protein